MDERLVERRTQIMEKRAERLTERRIKKEQTSLHIVLAFVAAFVLSFALLNYESVTVYATSNEDTILDENDDSTTPDTQIPPVTNPTEGGDNNNNNNGGSEPQVLPTSTSTPAPTTTEPTTIPPTTTTPTTTPLTTDPTEGGDDNNGAQPQNTVGLTSTPAQTEPVVTAPKITVTLDESFNSANINDGTLGNEGESIIPTGRLAGYEFSATKITSTLGTEMISLFFSKNSDTELSALSIDDFDLSGIDTDIYDVEYDLDCGIINIVKKSTVPATSTGSSSGSSTGTSSGSGTVSTETTIVYYNFTEVTNIESGKTYFYVPQQYDLLGADSAILGVPYGTAKLNSDASKTTSSSTFGNSNSYAVNELKNAGANYSETLKNNVNVEEKGTGFDGCKVGILYQITGISSSSSNANLNGLMGYWCHYGGAQAFKHNIFGRVYTYLTTTVSLNNISATIKEEALEEMPTGRFVLSDTTVSKYLDVAVKTDDGNSYTVGGCTLSDNVLDFRKGDDTITINLGQGKYKTIKIDTTGLQRQVWIEDNQTVIDAETVTGSQAQAIQRAISEGIANGEVDADDPEIIELRKKLAAAVWQKNNEEAILADAEDSNNYYLITNTNNNLETKVPEEVKGYIDVALRAKQEQVERRVNADMETFFSNNLVETQSGTLYDDATAANTDQILNSETAYENLPQAVKDFIDREYAKTYANTEGAAASYAEILGRAKEIKNTADDFVARYASILMNPNTDEESRETYSNVSYTNYNQILSGANAWNNLTEEERKYINKALNLGNNVNNAEESEIIEVSFEKLLDDARRIRASLYSGGNAEEEPETQYTENRRDDDVVVVPTVLKKPVEKEEVVEEVVVERKPVKGSKTNTVEDIEDTKKVTDDPQLRRENAHALKTIYNREGVDTEEIQEVTKKESIFDTFKNAATELAGSLTQKTNQMFGEGSIIINVQSWLTDRVSGDGMWTTSSAKDKNLPGTQTQVSYSLGNTDTFVAACLTTSELYAVNDGSSLEIRLRIIPNEERVSKESKQKFENVVDVIKESYEGMTIGEYIDISLEKRVDNSDWKYIPETNDMIRIALDVPEELVKSGRTFFVIRNHDGQMSVLRDLDGDDSTLTIETDRFSDYLVVYDDDVETSLKKSIPNGMMLGTAVSTQTLVKDNGLMAAMYTISLIAILLILALVLSKRKELR